MTQHIENGSTSTEDTGVGELRMHVARLLAEQGLGGTQVVPLSSSQRRLWFLAELDPQDSSYVEVVAIRLRGPLDVSRLRAAFAELVTRHASFRTAFVIGRSGPMQVVAPPTAGLPLDVVAGRPEEKDHDVLLSELAESGLLAPFELANAPLWRAQLRTISSTDSTLVVVLHHIIWDGASAKVLLDELSTLYDAARPGGAQPPPQATDYPDYARAERGDLDDEAHSQALAYWVRRLSDVPGTVWPESTTQRKNPRVTDVIERRIRPELVRDLRELTETLNCTPFMVGVACIATAVREYAAQDEIVLGVPVSVRPSRAAHVIGFFSNLLPLRVDLPRTASRRSFLESVRDRCVELMAHQHVPFDRVVEALAPTRSLANPPYTQVMFEYNRFPQPVSTTDEIQWELDWLPGRRAKCDVLASWNESADGLTTRIEYDTTRVSPAAAKHLAEGMRDMLSALTLDLDASVESLPRFPAPEAPRVPVGPPADSVDASRRQQSIPSGGRTPTDPQLADVVRAEWQEVLGVPEVADDDDFFERGGHSLLATKLVKRLGTAFDMTIPVQHVFTTESFAEFLERVASDLRENRSAPSLLRDQA